MCGFHLGRWILNYNICRRWVCGPLTTCSHCSKGQLVGLLGVVQVAHLADAVDPVTHVRLRLCRQVVGALGRLDVEHVLELLLAVLQPQAAVHLLALIQIDDALQLAAVWVGVVFEAELLRYLALLQREPPASPALKGWKSKEYESELHSW